MEKFQVIVGNIGTVIDTNSRREAEATYNEYVKQSESGHGRAGGESVTLWEDGDPIDEHIQRK